MPFLQVFRLRILLFLTLGFASACATAAYFPGAVLLFGSCIAAFLAAILCLLIRKKPAVLAFVILLGAAFGFVWMQSYEDHYLARLDGYNGQTVSAEVTVTDYSYETYYGISADGKIQLDGKSYKIRLYINDLEELSPGDRLAGQFELQTTTADGAAESDYLQGMGMFLVGYAQEKLRLEKAEELTYRYYPAALRMRILQLLDQCFPGDTLAFARALLLGDTRQLTYTEDTAYKISGIRHVVAVSGLHISILFSLVYAAVGKRRVLTALLGIPVLILFAAVAGFTPSVVRACTMQCLMILAMLVKKEYDPPTALAAAVLLILLCNPMSVLSVSLQLSVGSMAGIFLFAGRIQNHITAGKIGQAVKGKSLRAKVVRWCVMSVSVTLGAMSLTTPLCAYYFGTVSIVGILTNLLCLWMVSFVFYGIMLSCIVGALWTTGGRLVAGAVSILIRIVKGISGALSGLPFAAVYMCSEYIVFWLILCYCLLGLFLLRRKKRPLVLVASIVLSLILAIGASCLEPVVGNYLVTVMDVGQGQCVLLRCGDRNYLVDCGGAHGEETADKAATLLLSQGILALDGIIVTHYDADHVNGVEYLMQRVPAAALYLPDAPDNTGFRSELTDAFESSICWISTDAQLSDGDWRIVIFAGDAEKAGNESSLSVLFQRQNCDILITGDRSVQMEDALLDRWELPQLELLVVGHHGSASSTGFRLLSQTQPAYAAISVGEDNRYGHPTEQALARLERAGCKVLRTDRDGDINFGR